MEKEYYLLCDDNDDIIETFNHTPSDGEIKAAMDGSWDDIYEVILYKKCEVITRENAIKRVVVK